MKINLKEKIKKFQAMDKKKKGILLTVIAILVAVAVLVAFIGGGKTNTVSGGTVEARVIRGDVQVKIEGSGSVEPIERYDIMPLVKGTILEAPFEEGDTVCEGDLLYTIDYSDLTTDIEKAQSTLEKLYNTQSDLLENIDNLSLYANASGKISSFTLKEGDSFSSSGGKVAEITDTLTLVAKIPFSKAQLGNISVGQKVNVGIEQYMQSVEGKVVSIRNVGYPSGSGAILYDVEIHINAKEQNCEGLKTGTKVTATINGATGRMESPTYGEIEYPESVLLSAKAGGTISKVYVKNGDWVEKGQLIARFENDSFSEQLRNNRLDIKDATSALNTKRESMDDYMIKSQIDGVVITKNYKKGDNLQLGNNSNTVIMTVADMSKMVFYIAADELDIAKIKLGQSVQVSADALPGKEFDAEVTQIATEGTSTNGVATYQVKVTINNPEGLKPGMNVTGEIIIDESLGTLMVPTSAVTARGGRYFVYKSTVAKTDAEKPTKNPDFGKEINERIKQQLEKNKPENTEIVEVMVGINNNEYIEILSGLSEGDTVVITGVSAGSSTQSFDMGRMGGMPGGMGGGMPGGMGTMPSGGNMRGMSSGSAGRSNR